MKFLMKILIKAYQLCIAPYFGKVCRFEPSCSEYAIQSIDKYGCTKGCVKTAKRLAKCGPWHPGGVDQP